IVIQTQYMPDREITLNLKQGGDTDALTTTKEPIYVTQNNKKVFAFKAVVGEFSQKSNALNAADFKDHAIAKITLQSTDQQENKQYKDALNKAEGKTSPFYIAMDAEPANQNWFEVKYEEVFDNRPNLWYYGEGNWFELKVDNILNIYHTGEISKLDFKGLKEVSYVYHDKNGGKHNLGTFDIIEVDKLKKGKTLSSNQFREDRKNKSDKQTAIKKIEYEQDGVDAEETRIYADGDIITKGSFRIKYRIYKKGTGKVKLVKMKTLNYSKGGLHVKFVFHETLRVYSNPEVFSGFIGALAKCSFNEIKCTGSSYEDSSCYPSTTHVNGESIDTCYLAKKTDEQAFINALWDFGFKTHYVGGNMNYTHGTKDKYHNDHLHSGNFKPNYKK
ncbi:hypothetical protein, partial [Tenacibaculum maritimum]